MALKKSLFEKTRFYTAAFSAFILNLNVFGISFRGICSPGFNCHGCPLSIFACPVGVMTFTSAVRQLPLLAMAFIFSIGVVLGRLVCGFLCPFGWLQDILHRIPGKKIKLPRFLNWFKYGFLVLFVFLFPYLLGFECSGYLSLSNSQVVQGDADELELSVVLENKGDKTVESPEVDVVFVDGDNLEIYRKRHRFPGLTVAPGAKVILPTLLAPDKLSEADILISSPQSTVVQKPRYDLYFCKICPLGTMTASLPNKIRGAATGGIHSASGWLSLRFIILYLFILLMVLSSRPFCRTMCPLGAIYGLTAKISLLRFKLDKAACVDCGLCDKVCPAGLDVREEIGGMECVACGDCVSVCPAKALSVSFASKNTRTNEELKQKSEVH